MKPKIKILFIILQLFTSTVFSATVVLINGDKISGEIIEISETSIKITSKILGDITIPIDKITAIGAKEQYRVTTEDGREHVGIINFSKGNFSIAKGKDVLNINCGSVAEIKPKTDKIEPSKKVKWGGEIKVLGSIQRGTIDSSNLEGNIKVNRQGTKDKLLTEIWGNYGEVEKDINIRKYGGSLRYMFYPREKLYVYGETTGERDESRKLGLRYQIGAGTGYEVLKKEHQNLSFEGALLLTYEEYLPFAPNEKEKVKQSKVNDAIIRINNSVNRISQNPQDIAGYGELISGVAILIDPLREFDRSSDDFISAKVSSNFSQKISSSSILTNTLSLDTNLEKIEYYRFGAKTSLTTPLHENLSLEVSLSNEYDSDYKKRNIDAWEHRLSTGIKYEFR